MRTGRSYGLFEVFGLELEYMVVDRDSLKVLPIVDEVMKLKTGEITSDVENGEISWSNELTAHVLELKTSEPSPEIAGLSEAFSKNIREINKLLESKNAMLLPTAAHPFMDPDTETVLWPHEYNEVYELYNTIFDCKGHGWSNLQSFHINLPFQHDLDFEKLHAAIRLVLPVIPALSASSPILDGKFTGFMDARMEAYLHHQDILPPLMGKLIPEQVFTEVNYHSVIYGPIVKAIKPFDKDKVMDHHFLNSRGAIARFDRGAIEIRVVDVQECPAADMAICAIITELIKTLVEGHHATLEEQKSWHEDDLRLIFDDVIKDGTKTMIRNKSYLDLFGIDEEEVSAGEFWSMVLEEVRDRLSKDQQASLTYILSKGNLSERIMTRLSMNPSREDIIKVYREMAMCLQENRQL